MAKRTTLKLPDDFLGTVKALLQAKPAPKSPRKPARKAPKRKPKAGA